MKVLFGFLISLFLMVSSSPLLAKPLSVLAINAETKQVMVSKNAETVLPIASITKLMTAVVVLEGEQDLNERLSITVEDLDEIKKSSSRLGIGISLTRKDLLLLALMSSENRAASALSRYYPGGEKAFIKAMNVKAKQIGMKKTNYVEATGLSSGNTSTAKDLSLLIDYAKSFDLLSKFSTTPLAFLEERGHLKRFVNTNRLVRQSPFDFLIQKTGYIKEAGHCVISQLNLNGHPWTIVILGAKSPKEKFNKTTEIIQRIEHSKS